MTGRKDSPREPSLREVMRQELARPCAESGWPQVSWTVRSLIAAGMGVSLVPRIIIGDHLTGPDPAQATLRLHPVPPDIAEAQARQPEHGSMLPPGGEAGSRQEDALTNGGQTQPPE